ncbi:MAG: peroxiredoxin [Phycisphaeraceae bacterium]|nr:peroxiredoxin [Phycisphaeraceae bacterium]
MIGRPAPDFALADQDGTVHRRADHAGRYIVVFLYPKDDTPGCTKEACGFRDLAGDFASLGAAVFGLSVLDSASKRKFASKYGLNYPLLADPDASVISALGCWREKSMYGRTFMGVARETFVIGPDGTIVMHWPDAKGSEVHAEEVLAWLRARTG